MPQFAAAIREELARLTRKEFENCARSFKEQLAQQRRVVLQLKKELANLTRQMSQRRATSAGTFVPAAGREPEIPAAGRRFSAKGFRAHRKLLALSAEQAACLVGVSAQSVYAWEQGRVRPRSKQLPAVLALRTMSKREAHRLLQAKVNADL